MACSTNFLLTALFPPSVYSHLSESWTCATVGPAMQFLMLSTRTPFISQDLLLPPPSPPAFLWATATYRSTLRWDSGDVCAKNSVSLGLAVTRLLQKCFKSFQCLAMWRFCAPHVYYLANEGVLYVSLRNICVAICASCDTVNKSVRWHVCM